jgi:hypothetical protein
MQINPAWLADARRRSAYHEAGHTVMAMALGCHVDSVYIKEDIDGGETYCTQPTPNSRMNFVKLALLAASGAGAEQAFFRGVKDELEGELLGLESDQQAAHESLCAIGQEDQFFRYVQYSEFILMADPYRTLIIEIAEELLKSRVINDRSTLDQFAQRAIPIGADLLQRVSL